MTVGYFGGIVGAPGLPRAANFPLITIEVAFNDNVWAISPTWTDITRYAQTVTTTMGRQHELQQVNPSTAVITLWNGPTSHGDTTGGRFSPWNSGSPYYNSGNGLTPGHPVRITCEIGSTIYPVYYGYTQSWVPAYGQSTSTVTLNCYDAMALLNLAYMDVNLYSPQVLADGATAYWECQDPVGSTTFADATGNANTASVLGSGVFGGTAGSLLAVADSCFTTINAAGMATPIGPQSTPHVMFEGSFKTTGASQVLMSWAVGFTAGNYVGVALGVNASGLPILVNGTLNGSLFSNPALVAGIVPTNDGNWHDYVVEVPCTDVTGTYTLYVDGVLVGSGSAAAYGWGSGGALDFIVGGFWQQVNLGGTSGAQVTRSFDGSWDQIAYYQTPISAAKVANHHALRSAGFVVQDSGTRTAVVLEALAGVPSALVSCDTGVVQVQGATSTLNQTTVASYEQQVVNTERGFLYQDPTGVLRLLNRNHVYSNANSVNSQVTFTYDGSGEYYYSTGLVPAEDDTDLWNDINVSRQGGATQNASDSASITKFGRRSLTGYTSLLFENDADAADLAEGLLYQYKNPAPRVRSIKTSSIVDEAAALPKILALNLLDRVTIIWKPLDGSTIPFDQPSLVEQVSHTITPGQWDTTMAVTPIGTETFCLWDSGTWDHGIWGF